MGNNAHALLLRDYGPSLGRPILDASPTERRAVVENRAAELATLKDLRQAMQKTQVDLATALLD